MQRNVAGQVIGCQLTNINDGEAFTGDVTVYVTGDGGTQAIGSVGGGACTSHGNGYYSYSPAQAETDYALVAFTFVGDGAVAITVQIYTNTAQTGDAYAQLVDGTVSLSTEEREALASAFLDLADGVENGLTLRECQRLMVALLGGKLSISGIAGHKTFAFRDTNDSVDRVVILATQDGRLSAEYNPN